MLLELVSLMVDIPNIEPDFNAPGIKTLLQIASMLLAWAWIFAFIALIGALGLILARGFGSQSAYQNASKGIIWIFVGLIALSGIKILFSYVTGLPLI